MVCTYVAFESSCLLLQEARPGILYFSKHEVFVARMTITTVVFQKYHQTIYHMIFLKLDNKSKNSNNNENTTR